MKRAKGNAGEVIAFNEDPKSLKEEIDRRTAKAGYTTRHGECSCSTKIQTSVPAGKIKLNVWPRDKDGNLIDD